MNSHLTYLVTGANRGIGKGFVECLLQRPSTTVIAAVRDPANDSSKALVNLPKAAGSKIIVVKLDAAVVTDAATAMVQLEATHDVTCIDVVIANAAIALSGAPIRNTSIQATNEHFAVNTIGPLALYQATAPLLRASNSGSPKFVAISTILGSIGNMEALSGLTNASPYGASKAALNWIIRRLHFDEPWLTTFVIHPGAVLTDATIAFIANSGMEPEALGAVPVEKSVADMMKIIDTTSDDIGGTFQSADGTVLPW